MALAFVLQQTAEARSPSVKKTRDHIMAVINDKHQPVMAKSGAVLAAGIIDAGGRNVVTSMEVHLQMFHKKLVHSCILLFSLTHYSVLFYH